MAEVVAIVIVTIVMFIGLWILGWCYGDFRKPPASS